MRTPLVVNGEAVSNLSLIHICNIPILLAGIMFGPIGGALVGLVSDVLGSAFLSGLGWYPPITISAMLMGLIPGLLKPLVLKEFSIFRIFTVDFAANVVASMCWTTFWLDQLYGSGFLALLSVRVPLYIGISVLETVILFAVCRTSVFHAAGVRMIGEDVYKRQIYDRFGNLCRDILFGCI